MKRLHDGFVVGDRYEFRSRVASGGMGDVWEAFDSVLHRVVAVKIMRPGSVEQGFASRFRAEARHAARLTHPNIATVYDYGEHDDLSYLVMELVPGEPLSALLGKHRRLPSDYVRSVTAQAALALAAAHDAGVIHRDVKPANMMVRPDGVLKLTDFGISRALDGAGQTRTGEVMGTPFYLSPEQALGKPATEASDVYALGVVAHEMLSGARPFDGGTPVATALAHISEPPPPLPADTDADLVALVTDCLAKSPADRPASAREVAHRLGLRDRSIGDSSTDPLLGASPGGIPLPTPLSAATGQPTPSATTGPTGPVRLTRSARVPQALVDQAATGLWSADWTDELTPLDDLEEVLAALDPRLNEGRYAVVSSRDPVKDVQAFMTLVEPEGVTMLVRVEEAQERGLSFERPLAWITLGVVRAIGTLGFVPALTTALAQARIPSVAGVGRWHTHLFVPEEDADRAVKVLQRLSVAHQEI